MHGKRRRKPGKRTHHKKKEKPATKRDGFFCGKKVTVYISSGLSRTISMSKGLLTTLKPD